jgi:hypothetical protein
VSPTAPCWSRRARSGSWPSRSREPRAPSRFGLWRHRAESHRALRASRSAFPMRSGRFEPSEGEFPNWKQLVPNPEGGSFEFDPEELGSALRAATSVRSTNGAPVRLTLDRACSLALKDPDLGEMREALTEARFSPNRAGAMEVAFNPDYLADAIRFCGAGRGRMWVRDGLKPALFEGPDRRYVLMPIQLP